MEKEFHSHLQHLKELKEVISEKEYRFSFATIATIYVLDFYRKNNIKFNRQDLMNRVNNILIQNNVEEVSYFFFRKFDLKREKELVQV